ncbi:VWA domain-containing protein [Umezawaea sp. Da 62-37]|uniref:VWA domain-containing protein n=1 Tax=Umezawaea sp. Da 62-37 TaxID=3075927 RepID=UPI0028F6D179|nr:VWA domain-containing protein [Umezawaea sp. Da 62-37]WNV85470.1 VWA domain-containing protein [Umezawaea sp. Da 62-37]
MSGAELSVEVHQQKFLAEGDTAMHAILTVTARGGPDRPPTDAAEVLLVDCSTSMRHPHTKIEEAKRAAAAAIDVLPDGVLFAVVRCTETATAVYPRDDHLVAASDETRRAARREVAHLAAYGGTAMGRWLDRARSLFSGHADAVCHAILLTDGENRSETREALAGALDSCEGLFICDARGIGDGWVPDELAEIVKVLRGGADSVVEDRKLTADFQELIGAALTKVLPEVRLRIGTMGYSSLRFVKQVRPHEYDLTDRCRPAGDGEVVLSLGSFSGSESRDYHLCVDLDPELEPVHDQDRQLASVGFEPMPGARANGPVAVVGQWTHDPVQPTLVHPKVLRYTEQAELGEAITAGGDALAAGRTEDTERAWGTAARLAAEQGNEEILGRLRRVVDILDAGTGRVRLRPDPSLSAVLNVLISRVSRIGSAPAPDPPTADSPASGPPVTCPKCRKLSPAGARFCQACRVPLDEVTA